MVTKVKELPSVDDVETAKAVFVARGLTLCDAQGSGEDGRLALSAVGLAEYFDSENDSFTVSLTRLVSMLGESTTVRLGKGRNPTNRFSEVRDGLWPIFSDWAREITEAEWTLLEPGDKIVDIEKTCKTYGRRGPLPPTTNDEVTQTWRELTVGVLKWADARSLCTTVEDFLRGIGMEAFLPPRHVDLTAEWNGLTFDLKGVPANRMGEPVRRDLAYYIHQQINRDDVQIKADSVIPHVRA